MNCFIQHHSPHFQPITKDCSSVSHIQHCGWISLPAVHFHSIHLLFLRHSAAIRYGTSFPKIPNFNLVKKKKSSQIELSQQFPACLSWQNVFIAVQGSSVPMNPESVRHPRVWHTSVRTNTHTLHTNALSGEKQGANYVLLWQETAVGKSVSPQAGHSAADTLPACPPTVTGFFWYLSTGNKGTMETLKLLWMICWCCFFLRRLYNKIILNCARLCSLAHSLSLLRYIYKKKFKKTQISSCFLMRTSSLRLKSGPEFVKQIQFIQKNSEKGLTSIDFRQKSKLFAGLSRIFKYWHQNLMQNKN